MNTKLNVAVAAALFAAATGAQAGITIPAGDWTLDIGGVVNAYYTTTSTSGDNVTVIGGATENGDNTQNNITTGLLPNYLSVSGKTRQNDLDVGFTISINPGASTTNSGIQNANPNGSSFGGNQENRQAFLTFGDASWGSIKLGKDLGIYASDAILNDMTLLGVGSAAGGLAGNTTTLGRIGTGFIYADWKSQVAYSSPNWNGFQFTVGVTQAWNTYGAAQTGTGATAAPGVFLSSTSVGRGGSQPAFEGKVSYEWTGDVAGKVWSSFFSQKVDQLATAGVVGSDLGSDRATAMDIGATIKVADFGLTGYYNKGRGTGTTVMLRDGFDANGKRRDSDDWYVQATYTLPTTTKVGVSYGRSTLEGNGAADTVLGSKDYINSMWTVGAYHPITKHLNLVAEYSTAKSEVEQQNLDGKSKTVSLGAILFF